LLDKIIGIDYIKGELNTIPVLIISLGNSVGLVPLAGNSLYGIYIPEDNKFIPLSERTLNLISVKQENTFIPVSVRNIVDNPNLYNMLKPPSQFRRTEEEWVCINCAKILLHLCEINFYKPSELKILHLKKKIKKKGVTKISKSK